MLIKSSYLNYFYHPGKTRRTILFFAFCMLLFSHASFAEDGFQHIEGAFDGTELDGTTIVYSYQGGVAYRLSFYNDGVVSKSYWQSLDLEFGEDGDISWKDKPGGSGWVLYRAKKLDEGIYLVYWPYYPEDNLGSSEEGIAKAVITLRLDFNKMEIFATGLWWFGKNQTQNHEVGFYPGVIHQISRR